ncbi:ribonuclease H-like domain-containing protein [Tanacetum coccineum]
MDKCKLGLGYNAVPPPYTRNFMPPKPDLVYPSLDDFADVNEFVNESVVEKTIVETNEPKTARKENKAHVSRIGCLKERKKMSLTANNSNFNKRVNTVNDKNVNVARPNAVVNTARPKAVLSAVKGNKGNVVKASACWVWRPKHKVLDHGNPQQDLKDKGVIDSGCSRHMTGNRSYLTDYEEIDGGFVAFGGNSKGGKITRKGKIRTGKLDFEDVYFVKELKFNLFSVSQMCDKKNSVLFTDTECVVLSPDFKLTDESHVLLKVPRKDNMYSVDLKNVIPQGGLTCLFVKATPDESNLWHRRLGHVNFKTMNKLVRGNLVRGLPLKLFESKSILSVACPEGVKQHRASPADLLFSQDSKSSPDAGFKSLGEEEKMDTEDPGNENEASGKDSEVPSTEEPREDQRVNQVLDASINNTNNINTASDGNSTNNVNAVSSTVNAAVTEVNAIDPKTSIELPNDPNMPESEDIVYSDDNEDVGAEAGMNNLDAFMPISPILTTRIRKDHPIDQIIGDLNSAPQTRRMTKSLKEHGLFSSVKQRTNHKDFQNYLFACFLSQEEPKKAIGTKWFTKNKKIKRHLIKNKARLVSQGYTQEEGIDYDEVFAPVSRIEAIRLFLAYTLFKDFVVYHMDVKSAFLMKDLKVGDYVLCACARFQVNPYHLHLHAVKRIFLYLKGASLDRKSRTGGCQILGCKLISWQCKKKTMVANSTIEAEYIAASNCCGHVLWTQNQLLDYGYNFMQTKIHIDNVSTICIVKNLVFHSKTKHIENRHHFIRDSNKKKLIQMIKIYTNQNVADLLTKAFDVNRFQYLIAKKAKIAQDSEIASLKKKVKKLEKRNKLRTLGLRRLRKVGSARRVESSDEASLGNQEDASHNNEMEVEVEKVVSTVEVTSKSATTTIVDELTLAQTLIEIKATKPKVRGKPLKKKDQIMYDQEVALNLQAQLQAKLEEEERLTRQKEEEVNIALIES